MEVHGHECLHIGFETSTQIGDTGVNAIPERIEVVIVGAIQYLLFDESPCRWLSKSAYIRMRNPIDHPKNNFPKIIRI